MCFYNGTQEQPEKQVLKLSDAYDGEDDIEVRELIEKLDGDITTIKLYTAVAM